jgi:hypothetical protein
MLSAPWKAPPHYRLGYRSAPRFFAAALNLRELRWSPATAEQAHATTVARNLITRPVALGGYQVAHRLVDATGGTGRDVRRSGPVAWMAGDTGASLLTGSLSGDGTAPRRVRAGADRCAHWRRCRPLHPSARTSSLPESRSSSSVAGRLSPLRGGRRCLRPVHGAHRRGDSAPPRPHDRLRPGWT